MPTQNECLTQAMYLASESYSGSSYDFLSRPMDDECAGEFAAMHNDDTFNSSALAA